MIKTDEINSLTIDVDKLEGVETKILDLLNRSDLNVREIAWLLGQLAIDVGASLEGATEESLSPEEIYKRYFSEPTLGNAFMASGVDIHRLWIKVEGDDINAE